MASRLDAAAEPPTVAQDESSVSIDGAEDDDELSSLVIECTAEDWLTLPIYRLPVYGLEWQMPRPDAKFRKRPATAWRWKTCLSSIPTAR